MFEEAKTKARKEQESIPKRRGEASKANTNHTISIRKKK